MSAAITQFQTKGQRPYQEDRMVVIEKFAKLDYFTLCLVCDGHGGDATSEFLIHEYPKQLSLAFDHYRKVKREAIARKHKTPTTTSEKKPKEQVTVKLMGHALERCIQLWDEMCFGDVARQFDTPKMRAIFDDDAQRAAYFKKWVGDKDAWEQKGLSAGSTLNCMVIDLQNRRAHIINIGDSRTAWMTWTKAGTEIIGQTTDHAIKRKLEKTNGVSCNVVDMRLEGRLAMSHAVGDNDEALLGKVKRDYQTYVVDFQGQNFRAVTATDGLFDVRSSHQVLYEDFNDAEDLAIEALKSMASAEEDRRADMVDNGEMTIEQSQKAYMPVFVDNTSLILVKIPVEYEYKCEEKTKQDVAQLLERMSIRSQQRKASLKKGSKKKELLFVPKQSRAGHYSVT